MLARDRYLLCQHSDRHTYVEGSQTDAFFYLNGEKKRVSSLSIGHTDSARSGIGTNNKF